jgi:hypothetical protein
VESALPRVTATRALDDWRQETGDTFNREQLTPDRFDRQTGERNRA